MKLELLNELEQQHREIERLLKMLRRAGTADDQRAVLDRLVSVMTRHMEVEESEVYPELAHIGGVLVEEAQIEHDWTRNQLRQLSKLIGQPTFGCAVGTVQAGLADHVDDEENNVFPKLRQALTGAQNDATRDRVVRRASLID